MAAKKHKDKVEENIAHETIADVGQVENQTAPIPRTEEEVEAPTDVPQAELTQLKAELEEAKQKECEYLSGWQRERAEFFNYKKRMEREQAQGGQNAFANAIRRYLDIADDLDRALKSKNRPTEGEGAVWANGIDLILRKLLSAFDADGIKLIDTDEKFFDPNMHEAISNEDSPDHESGQIIEVVQPGYMLGERIIRPARVRVAR
ncbi:MAG TPA: nucleotide exchange factor GrpE [Anaerolineales bacterium]|nr:nucleotide exchange factor GrpE [Anaerolineales bacterium]